jgi:hypothetical protein
MRNVDGKRARFDDVLRGSRGRGPAGVPARQPDVVVPVAEGAVSPRRTGPPPGAGSDRDGGRPASRRWNTGSATTPATSRLGSTRWAWRRWSWSVTTGAGRWRSTGLPVTRAGHGGGFPGDDRPADELGGLPRKRPPGVPVVAHPGRRRGDGLGPEHVHRAGASRHGCDGAERGGPRSVPQALSGPGKPSAAAGVAAGAAHRRGAPDVVERVEAYDRWLAESAGVPKLLLTFDPGPSTMIGPEMTRWCQEHIVDLEVEACGPAGTTHPKTSPEPSPPGPTGTASAPAPRPPRPHQGTRNLETPDPG